MNILIIWHYDYDVDFFLIPKHKINSDFLTEMKSANGGFLGSDDENDSLLEEINTKLDEEWIEFKVAKVTYLNNTNVESVLYYGSY